MFQNIAAQMADTTLTNYTLFQPILYTSFPSFLMISDLHSEDITRNHVLETENSDDESWVKRQKVSKLLSTSFVSSEVRDFEGSHELFHSSKILHKFLNRNPQMLFCIFVQTYDSFLERGQGAMPFLRDISM